MDCGMKTKNTERRKWIRDNLDEYLQELVGETTQPSDTQEPWDWLKDESYEGLVAMGFY